MKRLLKAAMVLAQADRDSGIGRVDAMITHLVAVEVILRLYKEPERSKLKESVLSAAAGTAAFADYLGLGAPVQ